MIATLVTEASRKDIRYRRAAVEALTTVLKARPTDTAYALVLPVAEAVLGPATTLAQVLARADDQAAPTTEAKTKDSNGDGGDDDDDDDGPQGKPARLALVASTLALLAAAISSNAQGTWREMGWREKGLRDRGRAAGGTGVGLLAGPCPDLTRGPALIRPPTPP